MTPPCPPCVHSKRPRVYWHHAHMLKHMCACCRHTRARLNVHTEVFSVPHHTAHTQHNTESHTTSHGERGKERETEKEERERRQRKRERRRRKRRDKTREEIGRADQRQDEKEERRGKTRQEERSREQTRDKMKKKREEQMIFFENFSEPSNPSDELDQNVSKEIPFGRIIPPFFSESLTVFQLFT